MQRDFQKRNGRWYTSLCAQIIDFGCAVETDSAHEAETIGRLTGSIHTPGTNGYCANDFTFSNHFKRGSDTPLVEKISFLRHMDRHSLSVIFWAEDDDVLSCRNLLEPVYSSMSESELRDLMRKHTFGDRMNTPEIGCSLCRAAFTTAEDMKKVGADLMSRTTVTDINTVCESVATTIRNNSSVLRKNPDHLFTIGKNSCIEISVEQTMIQRHIRVLLENGACCTSCTSLISSRYLLTDTVINIIYKYFMELLHSIL